MSTQPVPTFIYIIYKYMYKIIGMYMKETCKKAKGGRPSIKNKKKKWEMRNDIKKKALCVKAWYKVYSIIAQNNKDWENKKS